VPTWYEQLREQYRPEQLEVLLIGESPPDPGAGERRFFYAPVLRIDDLYRGVAHGCYVDDPEVDLADKPAVLGRLQADGFWLMGSGSLMPSTGRSTTCPQGRGGPPSLPRSPSW
jgi:hypothetical protein